MTIAGRHAEKIESHSLSRYRVQDGKICIEINLRNPRQLFDVRDPAPFIDRDLDDDAVDYIVSSAEEFSIRHPVKLILYFSEGMEGLTKIQIRQAIHSYFVYQAELLRKKLQRLLKMGRIFLIGGVSFLVFCLLLASLSNQITNITARNIIHEGLVITGWVALWRPIELFLYDWVPLFEKRRYYLKLSELEIAIWWQSDLSHMKPRPGPSSYLEMESKDRSI